MRPIPDAWRIPACGPFLLLLASVAVAAPGDGSGKRGGRDGQRADTCGNELQVVLPGEAEKSYKPAADFLDGMETVEIDQGEKPRPAIELTKVLAAVGADWVKVLDCQDQAKDYPFGLPIEGPFYLVLTGRGALKIVRETRPGRFVNLAQPVQRLRFHAAGVKSKQPPAPAKP